MSEAQNNGAVVEEVFIPLDMLEEGGGGAVKVLVCRKWDTKNSFGKYLGTEFIVSDSEGNAIQCSARRNIAHHLISKLHEGNMYSLKNFTLVANKENDRIRRHDNHIIILEGYTVVKPLSCSTEQFDRFPFQLTEFEHIELNDSAYLIDVVGCVVDISKTRTTTTGSELVGCTVVNEREIVTRKSASVAAYIVVSPATNVKEFRREPYLSSTTATALFDSPDIPQISELLRKLQLADVADVRRAPVVPQVIAGSVYQLLHAGREYKGSRKKATTFHCKIYIVDIRTKDGWYYFSCGVSGCKKRVSMDGSKFMCLTCNKVCEFPRTSYRLQLNVADSTRAAVVTVFDDVTSMLIGRSAAQLLEEIGDEGDEGVLPGALQALVNTHHTFEMKSHSYYDQGTYESFTVSSLVSPLDVVSPKLKRGRDELEASNSDQSSSIGVRDVDGSKKRVSEADHVEVSQDLKEDIDASLLKK